jgi:transcriptional regulator with XRE-family HTH domain
MVQLPPETALPEIAQRLTLARQATGLAQGEYAARAGVAFNTYNQYENAKKRPSIENAILLCQTHKLTLDWIYRGDPSSLPYALADAIKALRAARGSGASS